MIEMVGIGGALLLSPEAPPGMIVNVVNKGESLAVVYADSQSATIAGCSSVTFHCGSDGWRREIRPGVYRKRIGPREFVVTFVRERVLVPIDCDVGSP